MRSPNSFVFKSPIPVYAVSLPHSDVLLYTGGGGQSRSGVANAIRSVSLRLKEKTVEERAEERLSNEEDAPMCMAVSAAGEAEEQAHVADDRKVLVGVNSSISLSGENLNLRLYGWKTSNASKISSSDSSAEKREENVDAPNAHTIQALSAAGSVKIKDADVYIKCAVISPDGSMLAVGSTDGQMALHAFPSLDPLWLSPGLATAGIVDATFSADSALVAFVTPGAIQIFPTKSARSSSDRSPPDVYQSIRNPSLKGSSGCVFRAARFGRSSDGNVKSSHLFTVLNTNPPAGLGSSKKDREKAKTRKCFVSSWDADTWTLLRTRQISDRPATVAEISDNGKHLAISTSDLKIHLLSTQSLKTIWQIRDAHAFPGTCLAFSPLGEVLASGSADMSVRIASVGKQDEPVALTTVLDGKAATVLIAVLLAFLAWYVQGLLAPTPSTPL